VVPGRNEDALGEEIRLEDFRPPAVDPGMPAGGGVSRKYGNPFTRQAHGVPSPSCDCKPGCDSIQLVWIRAAVGVRTPDAMRPAVFVIEIV